MTAVRYERANLGTTFLPVGQMLQLDRVNVVDGECIVAEMNLGPEHWVFPMHFPGDPVFPGCLLVEAAGQLVALWGWEAGLRGRPRLARTRAEFESPVFATDRTVTLNGVVRRRRNMCFGTVTFTAGERTVATIEAVIVVVTDAEDGEAVKVGGG